MSCAPGIAFFQINASSYYEGYGLFMPFIDCPCKFYTGRTISDSRSYTSGGGGDPYTDGFSCPAGSEGCGKSYHESWDFEIAKGTGEIRRKLISSSYTNFAYSSGATSSCNCRYVWNLKDGVTADECICRTRKSGTTTKSKFGGPGCNGCVGNPTDCDVAECKIEEDGRINFCFSKSSSFHKERLTGEQNRESFLALVKKSVDEQIASLEEYDNWNSLAPIPSMPQDLTDGSCGATHTKYKIKIGAKKEDFLKKEIKKIEGIVYGYYDGTLTPCCVEKIEDFDGTIEKTYSFSLSPDNPMIDDYVVADIGLIESKKNEVYPPEGKALLFCAKIEKILYPS